MIIKIKKKLLKQIAYVLASVFLAVNMLLGVSLTAESVFGVNVSNATVTARVNVSNTEPDLNVVRISSPLDANGNIDLTANTATTVVCNGSVHDVNGFDDIKNVTSTLYDNSVGSGAADDNNTHYTNNSCGACSVVAGSNNQNGTCLCQFAVQYYANPAIWQCNMTVNDTGGIARSENSTFYTVNEVLGISVENSILNYGNLSVTQTSPYIRENVTNGGNIPINITVRGFGGDDESIGML